MSQLAHKFLPAPSGCLVPSFQPSTPPAHLLPSSSTSTPPVRSLRYPCFATSPSFAHTEGKGSTKPVQPSASRPPTHHSYHFSERSRCRRHSGEGPSVQWREEDTPEPCGYHQPQQEATTAGHLFRPPKKPSHCSRLTKTSRHSPFLCGQSFHSGSNFHPTRSSPPHTSPSLKSQSDWHRE